MSHPARNIYKLRFEQRGEVWRHVEKEKDATHAVILIHHGPYRTELVFDLPEGDERARSIALHRRSQVERMIELAFDRGDASARADIRRALGVTEPRP